jgi:hypothetical protein
MGGDAFGFGIEDVFGRVRRPRASAQRRRLRRRSQATLNPVPNARGATRPTGDAMIARDACNRARHAAHPPGVDDGG